MLATVWLTTVFVRGLPGSQASWNLNELVQASKREGTVSAAFLAFDSSGKVLATASFGSPNPKENAPWTSSTFCRIASVSKPVTALAITELIQAGKLSLSTRAFEFLGYTQPRDQRKSLITVEMLLKHRSGYADSNRAATNPAFNQFEVAKRMGVLLPLSPKNVVHFGVDNYPLAFDPGTPAYNYANFNYAVLGEIVEKASGMSYAAYLKQLMKTKGIIGLQPGKTLEPAPGEAKYFEPEPVRVWNNVLRPGQTCPPAYGGFSLETILPFGGWIATLDGLKSFVLATAAQPSFSGIGWNMARSKTGAPIYYHGGSLEGSNAFVVYSKTGTGVVGLYNCGPGDRPGVLYNMTGINYLLSRLD